MEKNKPLLISEIILIIVVLVLFAWFIFASQVSKTPSPAPLPVPVVQTPLPKKETPQEPTPEPVPPVTESTTDALTGVVTKSSPASISIKVGEEEKTFPVSEKSAFVSLDPKKGLTPKKSSDVKIGNIVTVSFYAISKQVTTVVIGQ